MGKQGMPEIRKFSARILPEIRSMIDQARRHVATTADLTLVDLYWNIGRVITRDIQKNEKRAGYGEGLIEELGRVLSRDYGQGFSARNLWEMKRFYAEFLILQTVSAESRERSIDQTPSDQLGMEIRQTVSGKSTDGQILQTVSAESSERIIIDFNKHFRLGWSHYRLLLGQRDPLKRKFYFQQAASQRWSVRAFQRQIEGALFERVALSRNTSKLAAIEKRKPPEEVARYEDIFKDPYILDFLGLKGAYSEKDLEAAIIHNLEQFLTELGSDFCFIGRQYSMRIDDVDHFLDLLFFHRGLHCLVAIDLKLGTFTASDKGQMDLYLSWLKDHEWRTGENEPVGLILCSSKKRQHVELLLRHGPHKMQVSEYLTKLPPKEILEDRLKLYSKLLERDEGG
jgi:predicted nuclease of restriction endonuclease-like (RecB) superfamily